MSGPKVVRIVTREEMLALCHGQLARLDAAVEEWQRVGQRNDALSEADISATESRRNNLREWLAQERFRDLQKAVPEEIAFLQADQESRIAQAAAAAAQERTNKRRIQAVAASVLGALDRAGTHVPAQLRGELEAAFAGRGDGASAISQAFALLSANDSDSTMVTEHQRQLADALKESDDHQTFDQWLRTQPTNAEEGLAQLERRVAEVALTLGETATEGFADRLRLLWADRPSPRRSLQEDSLELDLAHTLAIARQRLALQSRLRLLAAELSANASEASSTMAQSVLAGLDGLTADLESLETVSLAVLERVRNEAAARARRQAVLVGLAGLGYQVTEGLETAWVRDGRVVLRKAMDPDYGVELRDGVSSARMQMRTVAIRGASATVDTVRDRDAETIWCGDLAKLQAQLAASGGGITVERALPVGPTPLKVVADPSSTADHLQSEQPAAAKQRMRG